MRNYIWIALNLEWNFSEKKICFKWFCVFASIPFQCMPYFAIFHLYKYKILNLDELFSVFLSSFFTLINIFTVKIYAERWSVDAITRCEWIGWFGILLIRRQRIRRVPTTMDRLDTDLPWPSEWKDKKIKKNKGIQFNNVLDNGQMWNALSIERWC